MAKLMTARLSDSTGVAGEIEDAQPDAANEPEYVDVESSKETSPEVVGSGGETELLLSQIEVIAEMKTLDTKRLALESDLLGAREEQKSLESDLSEVKSRVKDLNGEQSEANTTMLELSRKLVSLSRGIPLKEDASEAVVDAEGAWRNTKTASLFQGKKIKGFSETKLDAICELAPTIGDLEDLRGEASKECKPFNAKLPKGIGKAVAQVIEDALIGHIAQFSIQQAAPDPERLASIDRIYAEQWEKSATWTADMLLPGPDDNELMHGGFKAFREGQAIATCLGEDDNLMRLWLTGWVAAKRADEQDEASRESVRK